MKIDNIVQMQLDHIAQSTRKALGARVVIVIAGGGPDSDIACGITAPNDDRTQGLQHSMDTLLTVADSLMQKLTDGKCKIMIQGPDGLLPAGKGEKCDLVKLIRTG